MSGRYARVNTQDDDGATTSPTSFHQPQRVPNSPPPSFHSRRSSLERRRTQNVDSDLADAFDTDGDDSDDEPDDRQRLVRRNSNSVSLFPLPYNTPSSAQTSNRTNTRPSPPEIRPTQLFFSPPTTNTANGSSTQTAQTTQTTQTTTGNPRIYGGGIQSDGVFSNLSARPERGEKVVEELPPVSCWILVVPLSLPTT